MISQWEHFIPAISCAEGIECYSTRIELFYFDDYFRRIVQWVLAFSFKASSLGIAVLPFSINIRKMSFIIHNLIHRAPAFATMCVTLLQPTPIQHIKLVINSPGDVLSGSLVG